MAKDAAPVNGFAVGKKAQGARGSARLGSAVAWSFHCRLSTCRWPRPRPGYENKTKELHYGRQELWRIAKRRWIGRRHFRDRRTRPYHIFGDPLIGRRIRTQSLLQPIAVKGLARSILIAVHQLFQHEVFRGCLLWVRGVPRLNCALRRPDVGATGAGTNMSLGGTSKVKTLKSWFAIGGMPKASCIASNGLGLPRQCALSSSGWVTQR